MNFKPLNFYSQLIQCANIKLKCYQNMTGLTLKRISTRSILCQPHDAIKVTTGKKLTPDEMEKRRKELMGKNLPKRKAIEGVDNVVLVASGKGGVGKSTVAVNLAVGLKLEYPDKEIGLLDADIYGPSLPIMMNLNDEPLLNEKNLMVPLQNYGVKCMSMGFLVKEGSPIVWRGLMVMAAVEKLVRGVGWSPLDVLIVDMPPGTGDTQLSFAQTVVINGAIIVTTPQQVAFQDALKGSEMFKKTQVPVLGFVINMASFECSSCGTKTNLGTKISNRLEEKGEKVLGNLPFDHQVSVAGDEGTPIVLSQQSSQAKEYRRMAANLITLLTKLKDVN